MHIFIKIIINNDTVVSLPVSFENGIDLIFASKRQKLLMVYMYICIIIVYNNYICKRLLNIAPLCEKRFLYFVKILAPNTCQRQFVLGYFVFFTCYLSFLFKILWIN